MSSPRVSVLTAVFDPDPRVLEETIGSVLRQTVDSWEWILCDDRSSNPAVLDRLRALADADPRVTVVERETNGGIVAASNDALARARGEFVALLDHDDLLEPDALEAVLGAAEGADADYVYTDQDKVGVDGTRHSPYRKPDWSPERLRHHMYTSHLALLRRALVEEVGGFRPGYDGSQDHDLVLRVTERARRVVHLPRILYHWRQVPGSAAGDAGAKPYAWDAGVRAVQDHLDRSGIRAQASRGRAPGLYQVTREPDLTTPVSIIIPTIGSSAFVRGRRRQMVTETVRSVLARTAHRDLEFVVVYDTPTPPEVLEELRSIPDARIRLIEFGEPFNFSAKCNVGAIHATGEVLLFLNDDMEAHSDGVVETLIAPLHEDGVGATGPKLLFEDTSIQHAGVVYGDGRVYHSYYKSLHPETLGSHGDLWINREVSALTGACIAVRRELFDSVGGFSEQFPVNFNDVDFCFKIRAAGQRLVWLHDVVLFHFESTTRSGQVARAEIRALTDRWGDFHEVRERYSNVER